MTNSTPSSKTPMVLITFGVVSLVVGMVLFSTQMVLGGFAALIIGFVFVLFGVVSLIKYFGSKVVHKVGDTIANSASKSFVNHALQTHSIGEYQFTSLYTPPVKGKNARPSSLKVSIPLETEGEFEIVPESWFDRFGKSWGIAKEIDTGDMEFDEKCFIRTDCVEFTEGFLQHEQNREILLDLLTMGFQSIKLTGKDLQANYTGFDPEKNAGDENFIDKVGARLILLAQTEQPETFIVDKSAAARRKMFATLFWFVLIGYGLTVIAAFIYKALYTGDLLLKSLVVTLGVLPIFLVLALMMLKGTSRSHYTWSGLAITAVFLIPVGSVGVLTLVNCLRDQAPEQVHHVVIREKYTSRSKNKTNSHIRCDDWNDSKNTIKFNVSSSEYNGIKPGVTKLHATTKPGTLGIEWIVKWSIR